MAATIVAIAWFVPIVLASSAATDPLTPFRAATQLGALVVLAASASVIAASRERYEVVR